MRPSLLKVCHFAFLLTLVSTTTARAVVVLDVGDGGDPRNFGSSQNLLGPVGWVQYAPFGNGIAAVSGPVQSGSYLGGLPSLVYASGVVNSTDLSKFRTVRIEKGTNGSPGDDDYGIGGGTSRENQPEILTLHGMMLFEQSTWTSLGDQDGTRFAPDGIFRATYRPTFPGSMSHATFSFAVRNGGDFYVHAGWVNAGDNQVLTLIDPRSATWYQIDPLAYAFGGLNLSTGSGAIRSVPGTDLLEIDAVGFAVSFDTTQFGIISASSMQFNLESIPEPSMLSAVGIAALIGLRHRRLRAVRAAGVG
jgi:hypothetical protein